MSIQTEINRLIQAKASLIAQIEAKGVSVPADASLDDLASLVQAITGGEDLTEVLSEQDSLIDQILTALEGKAAGGGGEVGGLTQYVKTAATPTSAAIFTITNPLGGLAKKVSIKCPEGSATETAQGVVQLYSIDTTTGIGGMKLLNASTGNVTLYGVRQQAGEATSNSRFSVADGEIIARSYNTTTAKWDTTCEYEIEIWQ